MSRHEEPLLGFSLTELLTVIAIAGLILTVSIPGFASHRRRTAVRAAAHELRGIFHLARSRAIARGANCGVKFTPSGNDWMYSVYDDGDRDGIRNDDIRRGVDPLVQEPRLLGTSRLAVISLPRFPIVDPDGQELRPGAAPVHFNRSTICAFSPLGQATPGSIYLTDRSGEVFVVRVYGASAKMRLLRYQPAARRWVAQ